MLIRGGEVEERLIEQLETLRRSALGRTAIHVRLSALAEVAAWDVEREAAAETLVDWAGAHKATVYPAFAG